MRGRSLLLIGTVVSAVILAGCGAGTDDPVAQPAPEVTTFEEGRFDDLPQFPRSEPLGPRHEKDGVVARSYKAPGASPDQVLDFYRDALQERWNMVAAVEKLGAGTLRADWTDDEYLLRVSATREGELDSADDGSETAVAQYSLTLHPV